MDQDLPGPIIPAPPGSAMDALRAQRPDFVRYTQGSYETMVAPPHPVGLTGAERGRSPCVSPSYPGTPPSPRITAAWPRPARGMKPSCITRRCSPPRRAGRPVRISTPCAMPG